MSSVRSCLRQPRRGPASICVSWAIVAFGFVVDLVSWVPPAQANDARFSDVQEMSFRTLADFDTASPDGSYLLLSLDEGKTWAKVPGPDGAVLRKVSRHDFGDFFVRPRKRSRYETYFGERKLVVVEHLAVVADVGGELFVGAIDTQVPRGVALAWERLLQPPVQSTRLTPVGRIGQLIPTGDADHFFALSQAMPPALLRFDASSGRAGKRISDGSVFGCPTSDCQVWASSTGVALVASRMGGSRMVSLDGGVGWLPSAQNFSQWQSLESAGNLALVRTSHPDRFFAVTRRGSATELRFTQDGGQAFAEVNSRLPFSCAPPYCCDMIATDDGRGLVGGNPDRERFGSLDGGMTWKEDWTALREEESRNSNPPCLSVDFLSTLTVPADVGSLSVADVGSSSPTASAAPSSP